MFKKILKNEVVRLRKEGKTYSQILMSVKDSISKSTLSNWLKSVELTSQQKQAITSLNLKNLKRARQVVKKRILQKKVANQKTATREVNLLVSLLDDPKIAKIGLLLLYLCEGSMTRRSSLMFGNSSPLIIDLFLTFLRKCYSIQTDKFRCTVQCRADQNPDELRDFWSKITGIEKKYFYLPQIDKRTVGKATKKINYHGVCRIDYFSAEIYNELTEIARLLNNKSGLGPVV